MWVISSRKWAPWREDTNIVWGAVCGVHSLWGTQPILSIIMSSLENMLCIDAIAILVQLLFLIRFKIMFTWLSTPRVYPKPNFYVKMHTCENQHGNFNGLSPVTELLKILSGISCIGWSYDGWSSLSVWQDLESPRRQLPEGVLGCFQRGLTEKGRPVCNVGRTIPLTGIPDWMKRGNEWSAGLHLSLLCGWMQRDRLPHTPATMPSHHGGLDHQTGNHNKPSSLSSITVMRKAEEEKKKTVLSCSHHKPVLWLFYRSWDWFVGGTWRV